MKAGKYTLHELFANSAVEQLIVPEIQRDYVWKSPQVLPFLASLRAEAKAWRALGTEPLSSDISHLNTDIQKVIQRYYIQQHQQKHLHSIGFIYAYQDAAYPGRYFLIDGQQRLTTLYLLLLALAAKAPADEKALEHFREYYCWGELARLDYRVRETAHVFLNQLVKSVLQGTTPFNKKAIKEQYWFLASYRDDETIKNLLANYALIVEALADPDCPLTYEYVRNFVQFWYFNAGSSAQGEELYISMNSTGQPVEANENVKALMLDGLPENEKEAAGREWEKWQDYFWQARQDNVNADRGFNEFLRWASILQPILSQDPAPKKPALLATLDKRVDASLQSLPGLTFDNLANLMAAVQCLFNELPSQYPSVAAAYEATALLPFAKMVPPAWLAALSAEKKRDLQQIDYFRLLPILSYCLTVRQQHRSLHWPMLFRVVRYFHNLHRTAAVSKNPTDACAEAILLAQQLATSTDDITGLLELDAVSKVLLPKEEQLKLGLFRKPPPGVERVQLEALFWPLEDHPFNSGEVFHLQLEWAQEELIYPTLQTAHRTFFQLFPSGEKELTLLQNLLLWYGPYWCRESPWYYTISNFQDWASTVRTKEFSSFFAEFSMQSLSLAAFYEGKKVAYLGAIPMEDLRLIEDEAGQLFVIAALYDLALTRYDKAMTLWDAGSYIGFRYETPSQFPLFEVDRDFTNARRYLGSGATVSLLERLEKVCADHKETVSDLLQYLPCALATVETPLGEETGLAAADYSTDLSTA